jgi:hypothetical protein
MKWVRVVRWEKARDERGFDFEMTQKWDVGEDSDVVWFWA